MDNVRFHKTELVREFLISNNISFDFIPPYSPALNPIEEFFRPQKRVIMKKDRCQNQTFKLKIISKKCLMT